MRSSFYAGMALVALALPGAGIAGQSSSVETARQQLIAQQQGVWKGVFRRYDPAGALVETLPSEIHVRFPAGQAYDYHQTNILRPPGGKEQRIETYGKWDGARLRFSSARIDGAYGGLDADPSGLNTVLFMRFKDGSGMTVSEIVTVSPDGARRMRAAQYVVNGRILRRTLIDEERETR